MKMRNLADTLKESGDAVAAGDYAKALECLIWIHDNPDPSDPRSELFRRFSSFAALGMLAGVYEPAKAKLIELVAAKRGQVAAGNADDEAKDDLRALEGALYNLEARPRE